MIADSDEKTLFYTGLPSYCIFKVLYNYLEPKARRMQYWRGKDTKDCLQYHRLQCDKPGPEHAMALVDEYFAVQVRLRLGLLLEDVAERCGISASHFSRIFTTWISLLYHVLNPWPSRDLVARHTPEEFGKYPGTCVIIDCTEVYIQRPTFLSSQAETFSSYKHHNTFKVLVGISPAGATTFISKLWGGRVSD